VRPGAGGEYHAVVGSVVPACSAVGIELVVSLAASEAQGAQDLRRVDAGRYEVQSVASDAAMA
jgi:hypothetical protein